LRGFWRYVADRQTRRCAGKAAVGDEGADLPQSLRLKIAGRVQHLLHAGSALRAFVAADEHVARLHPISENALNGGVLALVDDSRCGELQDRFIDTGGLDHATVDRDVAGQNRKPSILRERMLDGSDHTVLAIGIQLVPASFLTEGNLRRDATRRRLEEIMDGL